MSDPVTMGCVRAQCWLGVIIACLALAAGCGGMDKLNDLNDNGIPDDEEQPPEEGDDDDWSDVDLVEECPQLCAAAIAEMGDTPGCTIACDIDILPSFSGVAVTNVAILVSAGAAGDFEAGQSCELVTVCETPCGEMLGDCMASLPQPPSPELLGLCTTEYRECLVEEDCFTAYQGCEEGALALLTACIDAGYPLAECETIFGDAMCNCGDIYNACLGSDVPACEEDESGALARISPPIQTGPSRFRVTRALLDQQLARLSALSSEIFVLPVFDRADKPIGFELRSIRRDDPIHSLGLRNGDVLLAVNDRSLVKGAGVAGLLDLYKSSQVRLAIRRAGASRQLIYDIVQK